MTTTLSSDVPDPIAAALKGVIDAFINGDSQYDLDIESLDLRVRISGPRWSGLVDRPIAKFLVDLDKKLQDELSKVGLELPTHEHGIVAIQLTEGSADLLLKYAKDVIKEFRKMKPSQQIAILVALVAAFGLYISPQIINAINAPKIEAARSKERVELVSTVAALVDSSKQLQQPLKSLVGSMDEKDTIKLPAFESPISKEVAKDIFEKAERTKSNSHYVDQAYEVLELSTRKPNAWEVALRYGGVTFRAKIMLSADEMKKLMAEFQAAHERGVLIAPDLHVTAQINEKGIRSAMVVGVGAARSGNEGLATALAKYNATEVAVGSKK